MASRSASVERCLYCGRVMWPTMIVGPAPGSPDGFTCGTPCPGQYRGPDAEIVLRQSLAIAAAKC